MNRNIRKVNIKTGMPSVEEARERLSQEIRHAAQNKVTVLKVIHGYGSSGRGGKIRPAIRTMLRRLCEAGKIRAFVPGEQWDIFDEATQTMLQACPQLERDPEVRQFNEGMTIVLV